MEKKKKKKEYDKKKRSGFSQFELLIQQRERN